MSTGTAGRAAVAVLALAVGGVVGACALLLHGYWWGLLLGIAATGACLVAAPGGWWCRLPFAIGWDAAVLALSTERSEGDYLVASDVRGYVLLGAGAAVLIGGIIGLRRHPVPSARDEATINAGDAPTS